MAANVLVELALAAALAHGIDGDLLCRLVGAESEWKVDAVSASGCLGLGQLNPRFYEIENPFDPAANLDKTASVLLWHLTYRRLFYTNDPAEQRRLAVASYTMGYNAVDRLLEEHGDDWMGALTPEVRRYVEAICNPPTRQAEGRRAVAR